MQTKKENMGKTICNSKINSQFVRQAKGITLIALVITIIIILILSTVTITTVVGDDGIIKQAQQTQQTAENSLQSETGRMNTILSEYTNIMGFDGTVAGPDEPGTDPDLPGGTNTTDPGGGGDEGGGGTTDPGGDDDKPVSGDSVVNKLKEGDWVYYVDKSGTYRKCRVLYGPENENYESFGLQIITMTTAQLVGVGSSATTTASTHATFASNINQYNTVIKTFDTAASAYCNEEYAEYVRCVGSVPNLPTYDAAGLRLNSYVGYYNRQLKDIDNNYLTDYNQMVALKLNDIDTVYWLASRNAGERLYSDYRNDYISENYIRIIDANGGLGNAVLFQFHTNMNYYSHVSKGLSYGLRLAIRLKPEVKVVGGQGNETDPYQLGV